MLVHFGPPKTGTSSIQESLYRNLSDPRFHYVDLGAPNASGGIGTGFKSNPQFVRTHARRGTTAGALRALRQRFVDRLVAQLRAADRKTAILSGEAISSLSEAELRALCDLLASHRKSVTAAGYVRRPKEYMESVFQQRVRLGLRHLGVSELPMKYRGRFEKFDTILGRDNVRVRLFDPKSFPNGCVVQEFCSRHGIDFRPEDVIRANDGLSLPALSLLFAYRKFGRGERSGPEMARANKLLIQRVRSLGGPKLRLHSSLVTPVIEKWRPDIDWMEGRLGSSLAEDLRAHDDIAIRSEGDLLRFSPEALRWLAEELGEAHAARWRPDMDSREVGKGMRQLRIKLAAADGKLGQVAARRSAKSGEAGGRPARREVVLNDRELVRAARLSTPGLEMLSDEDAGRLLREVFLQVRRTIDATAQNEVSVDGLGRFWIRRQEGTSQSELSAPHVSFKPGNRRLQEKPGSGRKTPRLAPARKAHA